MEKLIKYASENYTDEKLLSVSNFFRDVDSNATKKLPNAPKTAKQRR